MIRLWIIAALMLSGASAIWAEAGWKLVFADEFERPGLPDSGKWRFEEGYVRNREAQWYAKESLANTVCAEGVLNLVARRLETPQPNPAYRPDAPEANWPVSRKMLNYTSGSIETRGTFAFCYGKVEVRAKLPQGQGVWPAIWTLGSEGRHPVCGEIDIMEYVWSSCDRVHATVHFVGKERLPAGKRSGAHAGPEVQDGQFHLYTMEWDADRMVFSFDGKPFYTFDVASADQPDGSNPFRKPHYLKLNLALGDAANWGGTLDPACLPQTFAVDFVRIYQKDTP